jgi:hypothetical protein
MSLSALAPWRDKKSEDKTRDEDLFWATCPQCKGEFYCHWQEPRDKKIKLLCPYCNQQFLDEESPKIVE